MRSVVFGPYTDILGFEVSKWSLQNALIEDLPVSSSSQTWSSSGDGDSSHGEAILSMLAVSGTWRIHRWELALGENINALGDCDLTRRVCGKRLTVTRHCTSTQGDRYYDAQIKSRKTMRVGAMLKTSHCRKVKLIFQCKESCPIPFDSSRSKR